MTSSLDTLLSDWKSHQTDAKELRTVTILPGKSNPDTSEIVLKMSVRVIDLSQSETVSVSRKIQVRDLDSNLAAVKEGIQLLQNDFSKKCKAAFERLSRLHDKDSYNERNPY